MQARFGKPSVRSRRLMTKGSKKDEDVGSGRSSGRQRTRKFSPIPSGRPYSPGLNKTPMPPWLPRHASGPTGLWIARRPQTELHATRPWGARWSSSTRSAPTRPGPGPCEPIIRPTGYPNSLRSSFCPVTSAEIWTSGNTRNHIHTVSSRWRTSAS